MPKRVQTATTSAPARSRRGIQSVETGLRVLSALAAGRGASTLTAVGQRADLSPSQTHRYLQSLVATGMAVQDPSSRYDLGPAAIRIGIAALARLDVFERAQRAMHRLVEETGRTACLAVWGEAGATVVRWFPGNPPLFTALGVGSTLPLLHSAIGRVFLGFLGESEVRQALEREGAADHALPGPLPTDLRDAVRATLTARVDGVLLPGLRMVAAPVFDLQGRLALAAAAISGPAFAMAEDDAVAARLKLACQEATQGAGGTWPEPVTAG